MYQNVNDSDVGYLNPHSLFSSPHDCPKLKQIAVNAVQQTKVILNTYFLMVHDHQSYVDF